jgi:arylsulfatase A-like enzyme
MPLCSPRASRYEEDGLAQTLTRRDFLKAAGAGAAGMALLGTAGCSRFVRLPEDYLPKGGSRMNVVLVIIDSLRKDHVGAYGNDWIKTPNLDSLATESLRFTQAYPESIPSIPARRAIHTGLRCFPFRGWVKWSEDDVGLRGWQPIPRDQTTLAETLEDEGFNNLMVTDTLHQFRPFYDMHRGMHVFHFIRGQERDFYRPQTPASRKKMDGVLIGGPSAAHAEEIMLQYFANTMGRESEEDWFAPQVFMKGMEFLEAASETQPFFLVVDNYDPHEPWDPPEKYISLYDTGYEGLEPLTSSSGRSDWLTDRQLERMHALYSAEVTMMDTWLGRFLDKMSELNLFENTFLLLLSDHGHAFGEHGYAGKVPGALYPELTDITYLVRHPEGKGAGHTSDFYASTHDVAPTILGALGIEPEKPMDGEDLSVLLDGGQPAPREHFTAGYHDHVFSRDENYAMFATDDGSEPKLFDLREDPKMNQNIAGSNQDIVKRMWNDYVLKDAGGPP